MYGATTSSSYDIHKFQLVTPPWCSSPLGSQSSLLHPCPGESTQYQITPLHCRELYFVGKVITNVQKHQELLLKTDGNFFLYSFSSFTSNNIQQSSWDQKTPVTAKLMSSDRMVNIIPYGRMPNILEPVCPSFCRSDTYFQKHLLQGEDEGKN